MVSRKGAQLYSSTGNLRTTTSKALQVVSGSSRDMICQDRPLAVSQLDKAMLRSLKRSTSWWICIKQVPERNSRGMASVNMDGISKGPSMITIIADHLMSKDLLCAVIGRKPLMFVLELCYSQRASVIG